MNMNNIVNKSKFISTNVSKKKLTNKILSILTYNQKMELALYSLKPQIYLHTFHLSFVLKQNYHLVTYFGPIPDPSLPSLLHEPPIARMTLKIMYKKWAEIVLNRH